MGKRIFLDDAERILADVKPEQSFWVHNGPIARNLHELKGAIEHMSPETYKHHVHDGRNDFANWVRDVLKDDDLADAVLKINSQGKLLEKVRKRIDFIERIIDEERLKT